MADDADEPIPGVPTGATTLIEVLDELRRAGFDRDMSVTPDATVRCGACHHVASVDELVLHHLRRLEGASDPADMAAVLALECAACGIRGTAIVRYGPEAEPQDVAVLQAIHHV